MPSLPLILAHTPELAALYLLSVTLPTAVIFGLVLPPILLLKPHPQVPCGLPTPPSAPAWKRWGNIFLALVVKTTGLASYIFALVLYCSAFCSEEDAIPVGIGLMLLFFMLEGVVFLLRWRWCKRVTSRMNAS